MVKTENSNAMPFLRAEFRSLSSCHDLFRSDDQGYLSEAVQDAIRSRNHSQEAMSLDMPRAVDACAQALWDAITEFNAFRRDRGILGGLSVPDYEIEQREDWPVDDDTEIQDEPDEGDEPIEGYEAPMALARRLRRSRTQWGKIAVLAKEAKEIATTIEAFAQGYDYAQRMGLLARAVEGYEADDPAERPKLRALLTSEVARFREDEGMRTIATLLEKLATFRDAGGNPGYVFQRAFIRSLIPCWVDWTGEVPRRENRDFIEFVQAAYFVASARPFDGWANVMTTALAEHKKTSQQIS